MKMLITAVLLLCISCAEKPDVQLTKDAPEKSVSTQNQEEALAVDFKLLSNFELPIADPVMAEQEDIKFIRDALPKKVIDLNKKKVSIKGFMLPLQFNKEENIITFLLCIDKSACCFGKVPALNEVIYCRSTKGFPDMRDSVLEVTGILTTEPSYDKKDEAVYLYIMDVDSIEERSPFSPAAGSGLSF
ncbi:MAG: DUF3299 domain-containing protein [Lentisphaeraceae bacterium]|nr:DUF3299 domain-containing protein [Lentisphaeraceae bacterium]